MSRSSSASSTRSFGSEANAQDLKPIKGYLSNRRELARQLFKSVKPDKIRMMLPQILKNANLKELEERCAGELCGMSEARILCILKGRAMSGSSDTGETDDSGPSLEIISDTEEWLTDTEIKIKEEPSSSGAVSKAKRSKATKTDKRKSRAQRKKDRENWGSGGAAKGSAVARFDSNLKPKKEKQEGESRVGASAVDNKEGESLLDLLELEMRARAIRALIRKEEDTPGASDGKEEGKDAATSKFAPGKVESTAKASGRSKNEVKKPREERSASGEDEDVVFVVAKPTPTIELVSSEDETSGEKDGRKRASNTEESKRSGIERACKRETAAGEAVAGAARDTSSNGRTVTIDKSNDGSNSLKIVVTKRLSECTNGPSSGKTIKTRKICDGGVEKSGAKRAEPENEKSLHKNVEPNDSHSPAKGLLKKIRRKDNLRSKRKTIQDPKRDKTEECLENSWAEVGETTAMAVTMTTAATTTTTTTTTTTATTTTTTIATTAATTTTGMTTTTTATTSVVASDEKKEDRVVSRKVTVESAVKSEMPELVVAACANVPAASTSRTTASLEENNAERDEESGIPFADDDRLDDFEEIIDLDDYPDDMEELENKNEVKKIKSEEGRQARAERKPARVTNDSTTPSREASESGAETWASRYYQTDDVQNVIKESKIQSEIRKRLRERQRLSKSNNSPKLQLGGGSPGESGNSRLEKEAEEKTGAKATTTGSVREYLALKNSTSDSRSGGDENIDAADEKDSTFPVEFNDRKTSSSSSDETKGAAAAAAAASPSG